MASVILEGADGTGKTTLAKQIAEYYGWDVCHCTADDPADFDFYKQTARKQNVVWDRHTIGELIYPKVFHRKPQIATEDARIVLSYAREAGAKIFVLTTELGEIKRRLSERGEEHQEVLDNIKMINDEFLYYATVFHVKVIDTSKIPFKLIRGLIDNDDDYQFIHG